MARGFETARIIVLRQLRERLESYRGKEAQLRPSHHSPYGPIHEDGLSARGLISSAGGTVCLDLRQQDLDSRNDGHVSLQLQFFCTVKREALARFTRTMSFA